MTVTNFFICFACAGVIVFIWRFLGHLALAKQQLLQGPVNTDSLMDLIIYRMEHLYGDVIETSAVFQFLRIPFQPGRSVYYLLCYKDRVQVFTTSDQANNAANEEAYSIVELEMIGKPDFTVKIRQMTSHHAGVETHLHWGVQTR
ncbi:hypothetical protein AVT69_gp312 [Pseudomonas phage PhiPA3]|uniref:Uncharacterized protein 314 n=1 Tax=Pseudomonas phage PhiPA3 TaxID=998086 RepID=F8SJF0_BPPA3|nr:hypothetical protein AVT69_gp312 [Pseudomonas phage PhiPA3]AEH03737.1 hypothetical protein [Pseudomonas phage PhiPA3]